MSSLPQLRVMIKDMYDIELSEKEAGDSLRERGVDSLAKAEFLFEVEDKFKISVPEQHLEIDTLAELAVVVDQLLAEQTK
jgi:acyl carrier protein